MANMNMTTSKYLVKFLHRTASNTSDKRIADAFNKGANFDVDLITSDDKKVSAHRFVLALYSKYLATQIHDAAFNGVLIILLKDLPFEIVQKIVQLMYFREVTVHQDLTIEMNNALKFLKIDDTNIAAADSDQFKVPNVPQRRVIPAKKLGVAPIQQLQQQQQQPNVVRHEHMATAEQMGSYVAGKRKRAQSTFVSSTPHDPEMFVAANAPNAPNGVGNPNVSAMNIAQNIPGLNIKKVARPQPQPPKANSLPVTRSPSRSPSPVNQSNVGSMVETPEKVTSHPTTPNQSPIAKQNSLPNGNIGRNIPGLNITKVARLQPQPPKANSLPMTRSPSPVNQSNVGSMVETQEVTLRPKTPNQSPIAKQTSLLNGNIGRNIPGLNITKVARPQPQPSKMNTLSMTRSPSPVNQSNVGSIVETEEVTLRPTELLNSSPIAKQNGLPNGAMLQSVEKKSTLPSVQQQQQQQQPQQQQQQQQQVRPTQPSTIQNMPVSITIHKVNAMPEKSVTNQEMVPLTEQFSSIPNDDNSNQNGESDEISGEMETDDTQYDEDEPMEGAEEEEEKECDINGNFAQTDLRDIFPELR